jgi:hypothetical protein
MHLILTANHNLDVSFADEINAGAKWLAEADPRWFEKVHLDELDLASGQHCVLGQLAMTLFAGKIHEYVKKAMESGRPWYHSSLNGGYDAVIESHRLSNEWAAAHGFYVHQAEAARILQVDECDFEDTDHPMNRFIWETLTFQWQDRIERERQRVVVAEAEAALAEQQAVPAV